MPVYCGVMGTVVTISEELGLALRLLRHVLGRFATEPVHIDRESVLVCRQLVDASEVICTRAVGVFDADRAFVNDGCVDTPSWLATYANTRSSEGLARRDDSSVLNLLPKLSAAVDNGTVGVAHLRMLATAVTGERALLAVRDETFLVGWAQRLTVRQFQTLVNRWVALCDDELHDPTGGDLPLVEKRSATLHPTSNGMFQLRATLDPLAGETVRAAHHQPTNTPPPKHHPSRPGPSRPDPTRTGAGGEGAPPPLRFSCLVDCHRINRRLDMPQ